MPPNIGHTNGLLPKKGRAAQANRLESVTWLGHVHSPRQPRSHHHLTPYTLGSKGESPPPLGVLQIMFAAFPGVSFGEPVPRPLLCAHTPSPPSPFPGNNLLGMLALRGLLRVLSPREDPWGAHGLCLVSEDAENRAAAGLPARRPDSRPESSCSGFFAALSILRTQIHLFMFFNVVNGQLNE